MKEKLKGLVIGILFGAVMTATVTNAATLYNVINQGIKIIVDGKKLNPTDANGKTVEPIIYNGTTYLPIRAIASALGKEVYWDGPNYTVYLGKMDGNLAYPSLYLKDAKNIGGGNFPWTSSFTDNYGNNYNSAMHWYWSVNGDTAEYLLNMKFSRFKGTIAVKEGTTSSQEGKIIIKADGKEVYTTPVITKTTAPIKIDINIKGCNNFQIEFDGGLAEKIYIANAGFYQ